MTSLALLCSACAVGATDAVPAAPAPTTSPSARGPAVDPTPGSAKVADPLAPTVYRPVKRPAQASARVAGGVGGFSRAHAVTYPDGVQLRVDGVGRREGRGVGRGAFPGRAQTVLTGVVTNGSAHPIALNEVVVTTTYGSPPRLAPPVYDDAATQDFSGTVRPGARASARYVFAVPAGQRGKVTTVVDFDGVHAAATFRGAV